MRVIETAVATPAPSAGVRFPRGKGTRGVLSNASGRFEKTTRRYDGDDWDPLEELPPLRTLVTREPAKTIITRNESPDISFDQSINPYRGCEHGCVYCFARPTHAYLGLSAGLDFETRLFSKIKRGKPSRARIVGARLRGKDDRNWNQHRSLSADRTQGTGDATGCLKFWHVANHPVAIVTKSALVLRDLDLLAPMAEKGLVKVALSVTTLDPVLAQKNGAPRKQSRAAARRDPASGGGKDSNGRPGGAAHPRMNDIEIEAILNRAQAAGAREAGYVLLRLPLEVRDIFIQWLTRIIQTRSNMCCP